MPITFPDRLFVSLAERADVSVDFSDFAGKTLLVDNDANGPFRGGDPPDPETTAQSLQIRVAQKATSADATCDPASRLKPCRLRAPPIVRLSGTPVDKRRQLILKEIEGDGGPLEVLINNTRWIGLKESPFDADAFTTDYEAAFAAGFQPGDGPPFPYNTIERTSQRRRGRHPRGGAKGSFATALRFLPCCGGRI